MQILKRQFKHYLVQLVLRVQLVLQQQIHHPMDVLEDIFLISTQELLVRLPPREQLVLLLIPPTLLPLTATTIPLLTLLPRQQIQQQTQAITDVIQIKQMCMHTISKTEHSA